LTQFLGFFGPVITLNVFKNNLIPVNLDKSYFDKGKILTSFLNN